MIAYILTNFIEFIFIMCLILLLLASLHDMATRTVPNALVTILAVASFTGAVIDGHLQSSLLVGFGVFAAGALCWRRGWLGGADVKLLAATSVVLPPASIIEFILAVAIAGGGLAILYLGAGPFARGHLSHRPHGLLTRILRAERWRIGRGGPLPYACAITAGFLYITL